MPWDFNIVEWADWDGDRYTGEPPDTRGWDVKVHAFNTDTGEDRYFWTHTTQQYDSIEDWYDHIELAMSDHNMVVG